jgi:putative transposase
MAISDRGVTGNATYFVSASCWENRSVLQADRMARLFVDVLLGYRAQQRYALHEFVAMPNHFHLLITPALTLERAIQLIKGGFSFRAKKELGYAGEIWQTSFHDRRVRDAVEYQRFRQYIWENPVRRGLCEEPRGV